MKINYLYLSVLLISGALMMVAEAKKSQPEEDDGLVDDDTGFLEKSGVSGTLKGINNIASGKGSGSGSGSETKAEAKAEAKAEVKGSEPPVPGAQAKESSGGLAGLFGGHHQQAAPLESSKLEAAKVGTVIAPSATAREIAKVEKTELFSLKTLADWCQLLFNPFELVKAISLHFKLDLAKFTEKIGRGLIFGVEAFLSPVVIVVKIVEKVFVPDHCRLKFMCRIGAHLNIIRGSVLKFSPLFLEQSLFIRSFSDGIVGKDCEAAFPSCELRLKNDYASGLARSSTPAKDLPVAARAAGNVRGFAPTATAAAANRS